MKKILIAALLGLSLLLPTTTAFAACANGAKSVTERVLEISTLPGAQMDVYDGTNLTQFMAWVASVVGQPVDIDHDRAVVATVAAGNLAVVLLFKNGCEVAIGKLPLEVYTLYKQKTSATN